MRVPGAAVLAPLALAAALPVLARDQAPVSVPGAYRQVASEYGVPPRLLFAIALTESGNPRRGATLPWPWVLNVAGDPRWFDTRAEAGADLARVLDSGERLVDVGLMQVNWRYNGHLLSDPAEALDPWLNLRAGAAVLAAGFREAGDWWTAVGHYHSRTPERAAAYRERVRRWYRRIQ